MTDISTESTSETELIKLLSSARKNAADWQDEAGKLVSKVFVTTLSPETGDMDYLRALALCRWAQSVGVVVAKKKDIQPVRFRTKTPPLLTEFKGSHLVIAAIEVLHSVRAEWCQSYISQLACSDTLDKKESAALFKWASKHAGTPSDLFDMLVSPRLLSSTSEARTLALVKDIAAKANAFTFESAPEAAKNFASMVDCVVAVLANSILSKKLRADVWKLITAFLSHVRLTHPSVLVQEGFLQGIRRLTDCVSSTELKKPAQQLFSSLQTPTIDLVDFVSSQGGTDGEQFASLLLPALGATYADFMGELKDAAKMNAPLQSLLDASKTGKPAAPLEDFAANAYARLLPAWHDFYSSFAEADKLSVLNANLLEAAEFNGIQFSGSAGEHVPYDPISHRVRDGESPSGGLVRLVRPPLLFKRSNGTYRVVLPGIVELL